MIKRVDFFITFVELIFGLAAKRAPAETGNHLTDGYRSNERKSYSAAG